MTTQGFIIAIAIIGILMVVAWLRKDEK